VSDIRVLGGLLRIGQVVSAVTSRVDDGKITATRDETKVTGVEIAGMAVGIDEKGFTSPNGSQALTPIVEALAAPLAASGVKVHMTPGVTQLSAIKGTATSGFLDIEFTTIVQNAYPVVVTLSFGKASTTVEASGRNSGLIDDLLGDLTGGVTPGISDPLDAAGSDLGTDAAGDLGAPLGSEATTPSDISTPRASLAALKPMDFRSLYRWVALALAGAIVARWVVVGRLRERDTATRPNLRSLWRW
jgi:hypothetical protein